MFLQITPGTNVALYNGMMNVIIAEGLQNSEYIEERTEKYEDLVTAVLRSLRKKWQKSAASAPTISGLLHVSMQKPQKLQSSIPWALPSTPPAPKGSCPFPTWRCCAATSASNPAVSTLFADRTTFRAPATWAASPATCTGYQKVANPDALAKFEKAWGVKLSDKPGLTLCEIVHKAGHGDIKFLYIMGENPMVSDPDLNHVEEALKNTEFLVVQDIFLTETAALADVVLPAASFAEKEGTFSNTERRVQRVRKAIEPVGKSKADWVILMDLLNRLGIEKKYSHPSEIMAEISSLTPSYGGITYERLDATGKSAVALPDHGSSGNRRICTRRPLPGARVCSRPSSTSRATSCPMPNIRSCLPPAGFSTTTTPGP